jgi:hypothetical protein
MISSVAKFVEIFFLSRNISLSHTLQKYFSFTHTSEIFVELSRETFYKFSFYNTNDIPKSIIALDIYSQFNVSIFCLRKKLFNNKQNNNNNNTEQIVKRVDFIFKIA